MRLTRSREDGFTLIELLVGMVLSTIVLALIVAAIIAVFGGSDRTAARNAAQRSTVAAVEQLTVDMRAARAPERDPVHVGSPDGLRDAILRGTPPGLKVHDVLEAEPSRLRFYAEMIDSSPGVECVLWAVQPDGSLQRDVFPSASCMSAGAGSLQKTVLMPAPATGSTAAAAAPAPFSYRMLVQPNPADPNLDPSACRTGTAPRLGSDLQRDQIVGVDMDLRAFVTAREGRGDQELISSVSIPSRQGQDYRYGIGCVA